MWVAPRSFDQSAVHVFRRLVAFDTTSDRSNVPAADYLADYLEAHGCAVASFADTPGGKVNLLARKGPDQPGGLLLSGHLDVVPATEDDWQSDPFELAEYDDRFVARGSADMKGFVSLAVQLLADADARHMHVPLAGLFTHDEEIGTIGAQAFVRQWDRRWHLPTSAIVGEPTELRVVRMHKGHMKVRVCVEGASAHSGYPHLGSNAIEKLGRVIDRLIRLREQLEGERCATSVYFPHTPYVVLNQALVHGGSAINIVPDRCTLEVGVRLLPGQSSQAFFGRLQDAIEGIEGLSDDVRVTLQGDSPPLETAETSELSRRLTGHLGQAETCAVSYASDAGPLAALGVESVLFGPGSIEVAHKANEFLPKTEYKHAGALLRAFAGDWCHRKSEQE